MRLDVALVDRRGAEAPLDDDLRRGEALRGVALGEVDALGDVRRLGRLRLDAVGAQVVVQDRGAGLHRLLDVDHVRQHAVAHVDELERLARDRVGGRGDRGHGMAVVERLLARHDVARDVAQVHLHLARGDDAVLLLAEVGGGDDGLHAGQRGGLRGVDRLDDRMGVRAAQDAAHELSRHVPVGAEARAAGDLVGAIGTAGAGADDLELASAHREVSFISAATSMTARTILS